MKILMVGDVIGRPGRKTFAKYTKQLKKDYGVDVVVVNGENSAGGKGVSQKSLSELYAGGADIVTTGNHVWDNREIYEFVDREPYLVRPANYPQGAPGRGYCIFPYRNKNIAVINLSGRAFMPQMDCPFQKVEEMLAEIGDDVEIVLVDFHAETTSEKQAMGYYLDGRVQAVVGTHTHVQTADERMLPNGTAYITDLGMTGPWNSVLGVETDIILKHFTTCMPVRHEIAKGPCVYSGLIVEIDDNTNAPVAVQRIMLREE